MYIASHPRFLVSTAIRCFCNHDEEKKWQVGTHLIASGSSLMDYCSFVREVVCRDTVSIPYAKMY